MNTSRKANYVRSQKQFRPHHCHWPGCTVQVPPAMWGCKYHWYKLPLALRTKLWQVYKPGQEVTLTPSVDYLLVAEEIQLWIARYGQSIRSR